MQRILVLNYEFPPLGGGAAPVSFEIAKQFVETGNYEVDVVTMGFQDLPGYEEINPHFRVHRVKCVRRRKEMCQPWEQATYLISAYFKVRRLVQKYRYDFCHCHFIIPTGALVWVIKKQYGIPYIISVHGSDVPGYNPDRFTFLHKFTGFFLKVICDGSVKIVALSQYLKKLIRENIHNYPDNKLIVIPNGIDPDQFVPMPKDKIILSTGRLLPRKGFQYLIQSVTNDEVGYEVHICGDGPMMEELQDLAKRSKTKIVFHGWVDNSSEKYKQLLGKASIYCLVSSRENSSIALLEAMSSGCAVITSNITGCPETVGESGVIVPPDDIAALKKVIVDLTTNQNKVLYLQTKARNRIQEHFDWKIIIQKYLETIEQYN